VGHLGLFVNYKTFALYATPPKTPIALKPQKVFFALVTSLKPYVGESCFIYFINITHLTYFSKTQRFLLN